MKLALRLQSHNNDSGAENLKKRFLRSAVDLYHLGKAIGIRIIPTHNSSLPLFSKLTYEKQLQIVEILEASCEIYNSVRHEHKDIRSNSSVVWAALKSFNLLPPSDFFDKFDADDVIQIYSNEGFHRFANLRFFEVCSYTVEQVYSLPWPELWQRTSADLEKLVGAISFALGPELKTSIIPDIPPHKVIELKSALKFELEYRVKCIAPTWSKKTKEKDGFIIIENGILLREMSGVEEEAKLKEFYQLSGLDSCFLPYLLD